MRIYKVAALLGILFLVIPFSLAAYDYDDDDESNFDALFIRPTLTPSLTGYFTGVMSSVHTGILAFDGPCIFFIDDNLKSEVAEGFVMDNNIFVGGMVPIVPGFAIPLFTAVVLGYGEVEEGSTSDNTKYDYRRATMDLMLGGGLVVYGDWGVLGGHAGYGWERGDESGTGHKTANYKYDFKHNLTDNKLRWAVLPLINAKKYPVLNSFVRLIGGFFAMDNFGDEFKPTYAANVIFRNIPFRYRGGVTLSAYAKKDYYDFDAKYNLYAGKVDLLIDPDFSLLPRKISVDLGYRDFFDVTPRRTFENGIYANISLKWFSDEFGGIEIFCESSSTNFYKNPSIGIMWSYNGNGIIRALMRFGQTIDLFFRYETYLDEWDGW